MVNITAEEFLRPFFDPAETVCLRVFDDKRGTGGASSFKGAKLECEAGKIGGIIDTLKEHNEQGRGIHFVINYGGHEDADITRINAQFTECDDLPVFEQWARIEAFSLPPSLIVKTQKSLHCYWLMKDARVTDFRRVQKKLALQFQGDKNCVNESRVFRLPGFFHCKNTPVMVECVKFSPELRYTQAELEAALPELPGAETANKPAAPAGNRKGLAAVVRRCLFIRHCGENAAALPEHDWYAMVTNLAVFESGNKAIHELSKNYPKYSYEETRDKIRHFFDSGTKPMTCAKIAEKGFKCPNLETGTCGCKSPAALCCKPPDISLLKEFLGECQVKNTPLENVQAARDFLAEYLYNVEPAIAEAFLTYEAKAYFKLKSGDVKPLISLHKEIYKKYADNKDTRRETEGSELPDWYEPTERGGIRFLPGLLAEYMAKEEKAFYSAEQYYAYTNGVYGAMTDLEAKRAVRTRLIPRQTTLGHITDAEGQWRMLVIKPLREINSNPYIINVKNGLYNVLDGSLSPHSPEYLSTVQLNVNYTPGSECPRFMKFLEYSISGSEIPLVQEMLGYFLIPVNKAQKSFVIVGEPGAGKSKLLLTLNEILLGQKNVSNIPWQSLNERFKTAELFGKLANIFADLPTKNIDDNGIFKALVGEDFLTAERKNKDPFTFQPYARLLFSCNAIPRNYGDKSDGFYRRLIIIRFSRAVPEEKRDAELLDKFAAEADGIFLFAVEGLKRLIANKYKFSETDATKAELQRYRIDSNSVLSFVEDNCEIETKAETERGELFIKYREYCHNAGLSPVSQKTFNKDLELSYPQIKRGVDKLGKRRTWKGVKIIDD
jgi:putative DNA primase/helicase